MSADSELDDFVAVAPLLVTPDSSCEAKLSVSGSVELSGSSFKTIDHCPRAGEQRAATQELPQISDIDSGPQVLSWQWRNGGDLQLMNASIVVIHS